MNSPVDTLKGVRDTLTAASNNPVAHGHMRGLQDVMSQCSARLDAAIAALTGGEAVGHVETVDGRIAVCWYHGPMADGTELFTTPRAAAGMVLVPREPTEAMIEAAERYEDELPLSDWGRIVPASAIGIYRAMLSALPDADHIADAGKKVGSVMRPPHGEYPGALPGDGSNQEFPECSGDPKSCPENEGFGCCKAGGGPATTDPVEIGSKSVDGGAQGGEIARLRELAATCYAGLVAECNLPEAWADVFLAATEGTPFTTEGLLPFVATTGQVPEGFALVEVTPDEVLVALRRGEGYEGVHPQLVTEDAIGDRWPEYRTITEAATPPASTQGEVGR